jgi:hypothetical protein
MIAARSSAQRFAEDLVGADYNRFATSTAAAASFKQWVHVAVLDPAIALIANFSAMTRPDAPGGGARGDGVSAVAHRLTTLVHAGALRGHVRAFAAERCAMPAGRTVLAFGGNRLAADGDIHHLELDEPALALHARLTLRAVARSSVLHHLPLGGAACHWAVVPRLVASGTIEHAGRCHVLVDTPAYRDRNWGAFRFGEVAWDWGYAAAPAGGPPCAIAFARLLDAPRTRVIEQQVLVWWGARLLGAFRDREIGLAGTGDVDGPLLTIPPALALCRPGRATGVPETVTVTARSSRGWLELGFARTATARIVVPAESRLGTTAIYESLGEVTATGRVDGQDVQLAGRGVFECVHA